MSAGGGVKKGGAVGGDKRVNGGIQAVHHSRIGGDQGAQGRAVDAAVRVHRLREKRGDGKRGGLAGGIEAMHGGIGIPDRDAFVSEHRGSGGFAHADGAGKAKAKGHAERTAWRVASSTSGRWPNQRSKPGAA